MSAAVSRSPVTPKEMWSQYDHTATVIRTRPAIGAKGYASIIRRPHTYSGARGPGTFVMAVSTFAPCTTTRATRSTIAWCNVAESHQGTRRIDLVRGLQVVEVLVDRPQRRDRVVDADRQQCVDVGDTVVELSMLVRGPQ